MRVRNVHLRPMAVAELVAEAGRAGRHLTCRRTHTDDDPQLGKPLCLDCYDHRAQVVWNAHASEL